jgi:NhaB family Na+:H+ antiporter
MFTAIYASFLGRAPGWYKLAVIAFLVLNPIVLSLAGPFVCGWLMLLEFIFALAMALKCYPLQPGGLIALESVALGLTTPQAVAAEVQANFAIILLLIFMVAGIYFMREMIVYFFSRLLLKVRSKTWLALLFCFSSAILSAFLDALTVIAVVITVATGLYHIWDAACGTGEVHADRKDLEEFRGFLRSLVMHSAVGTALGGVCTLVGEPQNLVIGHIMGWNFMTFFHHMAPVSIPVLVVGLATCAILEKFRWFGYGGHLPAVIRERIALQVRREADQHDIAVSVRIGIQAIIAALLVLGLALHVAEVGLIGLSIIVLATAFTGVIDEKRLGHAFEEALPFTALLGVFFIIVAVIHDQHLFHPVITAVLDHDGRNQLIFMYVANGLLSAISDNVFVATVYITELQKAFESALIDRHQFEQLAIAVNVGTNIPSVATPNGQAAFLFLLTSALAPLIRLGYGTMFLMALPYTVILSGTALGALWFLV